MREDAAGRLEGDWRGMVVLCAANSWDGVKMQDRHLAERLTAHAPVLYVDPPMSHLTRLKNPAMADATRRPHLRVVAPRIARYTPLVAPKPSHPRMTALTSRMVRHQLRGAVRQLGGDVHTVINTWLFFDTYGVLGEQRRVFWWSDDPAAAAAFWGADADRLRAAEERLARASDLVVAVNEEATRRWEERGQAAAYVPNGCDPGPYRATDEAPDPGDVALPGPIAGFVGHLNSRTDLALLEAVADAGTSLLLIGPKDPAFEPERFAALAARPNVVHLGPRPFETLPSYLRLIDVGLVPYGDTEFNRLSFPLKTLEYLAAGRAVVSTPLPAVRWLETELVTMAATPDAFAASVAAAAAQPRDAAIVGARQAFAERHSWARRAEAFAGLLGLPA